MALDIMELFDVTAIDEIIFIIPVGSGYDRLACKSGDCNPVLIDFHRGEGFPQSPVRIQYISGPSGFAGFLRCRAYFDCSV